MEKMLIFIAVMNYLGFGFILAHKISDKYPGESTPSISRKFITLIGWPLVALVFTFAPDEK